MTTPESKLILIVDDEEMFREIFSKTLSAAGFRTETADGAEIGIAKAKSLKPDLVLLDVKMPKIEGPAAAMMLREDPALKDVKIAFLTNLGDPRLDLRDVDKKFSEEFGVQDYLKKTDDLDALVQHVKAILQQ